jgi:hypothetical protein
LLLVHVAAGGIALTAGFATLPLRKGGDLHARLGTLFFAAMLAMTSTGAVIAALKPERGTLVVGIFTFYLVLTSWMTARNRAGIAGGFERWAASVALLCGAAQLYMGLAAIGSPTGRFDSLPAAAHFPFAVLAALAAALDLGFIRRGRLDPRQRIARHLWRMGTALLIAAFSFFLGQQDELPEPLRGAWVFAPPLTVLAVMLFWIFRVRFAKVPIGPRRRTNRIGTEAPAQA